MPLSANAVVPNPDIVRVLYHGLTFSVKASCFADAKAVSEDSLYLFERKARKFRVAKDDDDKS
jgi:hypothetical protein